MDATTHVLAGLACGLLIGFVLGLVAMGLMVRAADQQVDRLDF